jgi:hypothetical protein
LKRLFYGAAIKSINVLSLLTMNNQQVVRKVSHMLVLAILAFVFHMSTGCRSSSCPKMALQPSPFIVSFDKENVTGDTLQLAISIYNMSDSPNLVYIHPYISIEVLNDPSLESSEQLQPSHDYVVIKEDAKGKSMINCRNCFAYYAQSPRYKVLKKGESYTYYKKVEVKGLRNKPDNYSFTMKLKWNIPSVLNAYCPSVWTGNVYAIDIIKK